MIGQVWGIGQEGGRRLASLARVFGKIRVGAIWALVGLGGGGVLGRVALGLMVW